MNILIFRTALLAYSETFIPAQAEKLSRFTPYYAGFITVPGLTLPRERVVPIDLPGRKGKWRDTAALFGWIAPGVVQQVRAVRPALIHAHFEEGGIKAAVLADRLKIPLVTTCHGYDVTEERHRWQGYPGLSQLFLQRRRHFLKRGDLFIGVSRFICDQMLRRGYPAKKVRHHYIGLDTDAFIPDPAVTRKPTVLFVGRLVEKKGCADLIHAMARVTARFPEMSLEIIGDGPLRGELESLAQELRVPMRFRGAQSQEVVRRAMAEAAIFCGPSVRSLSGDSEGLGMVFLEAMALGTPVVATRHGGIPEVVSDGETGLLVPERSPEELAEALGALAGNPSLREKMGAAGRARVMKHFDLTTQTRELEELYSTLLK